MKKLLKILLALLLLALVASSMYTAYEFYVFHQNKKLSRQLTPIPANPATQDHSSGTQQNITASNPVNPEQNSNYTDTTFFGIVKGVKTINYQNNISIDIIQMFSGKTAFLEYVRDTIQSPRFDQGNTEWQLITKDFHDFNALSYFINNLSDEQFDTWYGEMQVAFQKQYGYHPGGILGNFPNGFNYSRNTSSLIREFPISGNLKEVEVDVPVGKNVSLAAFLQSCTKNGTDVATSQYCNEHTPIEFTTQKGSIVGVRAFYRP